MLRRPRYTPDELASAVASATSSRQALIALGVAPRGGNYRRAWRLIRELRLDTSHFTGQGWRLGSQHPVVQPLPLQDLLVEGRPTQTSNLRVRLIAAGLKRAECEVCGGREWQGHPIPLELDHISGQSDDNRMSNLRLLCPNCHALTSTYRGRNIGSASRYALGARVPER